LGIDENIRSGYMFLAQNYLPGDEIFLFGFSRGAFTARSLAGFINACGLLKRQHLGDLGRAWTYYRGPGPHTPEDFLARCNSDCHVDATIKFLGVWDTVGALGIPVGLFSLFDHSKYGFHDTGPCKIVKHGCHALAIDEHRDEFVPTLWTGKPPEGVTIEQVWFAGAHADVGGGYITRNLADIPLVWMAQKAEADGLALDWSCLPNRRELDPLAPIHDSRTFLFAADRLRPTYRQICELPCDVTFYERLYAPLDIVGQPLATINEAIHWSVLERYGAAASICSVDQNGSCNAQPYRPINVQALLDANGKIKTSVRVATR
jgi:type VI secretion system (T6SS) phospholipase Tle1-like effector